MALCRTNIGAAAAFHAQIHTERLELLRLIHFVCLCDRARVEPQRTICQTRAAVDARRCFGRTRLRFVHDHNGVGVFEDRRAEVRHRDAHHGTAVEHLCRLRFAAAGALDHVGDRRTDRRDHVLWLSDGGAVHGQALFDQRHAGFYIFGDKRQRGDVDHDHAHIERQAALRNESAERVVDQHLFAALRIHGRQHLHLHALDFGGERTRLGDRVGLVVLDTDHIARHLEVFFEQLNTGEHIVRAVEQGARVRGDIRLALGGVDHHRVHHAQIVVKAELDKGRKARAAQADGAAVADSRHKAREVVDLRRLDLLADLLQAVRLDHHDLHLGAHRGHHFVNFLYLSRNTRMHRRRDVAVRFRDQLSHLDRIAALDDRLGRSADVHGHRDRHQLGHGNTLRRTRCGVFLVRYPDTF